MKKLSLFLTLCYSVNSFSISETRSDIGATIENPASTSEGAQSIHLECGLTFNSNREKWTTCKWTKSFPDVPVDWNQRSTVPYAFIMCTATHLADDGNVCEDQGNLNSNEFYGGAENNPYTHYDTDRLLYDVRDNMCGLTITRPHANDTGEWKCFVTDNNPEGSPTTLWGKVNVFTAEKSVVNITKPDLIHNPSHSITVDLSSTSKVDIESLECTASGIPPPNIIWYIDSPSNRLDQSLSTQREVADGEYKKKIVSTLSRLPIDRSSLSRYGIRNSNSYFAFSVGCFADQGGYFSNNNNNGHGYRNPAEVMVYGTSGGSMLISSSIIIIIAVYSLL